MFAKYRFFHALIVGAALLALAACTPPAATGLTPTAPTEGPRFEGLSSRLDNAKQARIRTVSMIMYATNVDVYVNGSLAYNGGVALQNIVVGRFSGWLYVTPGTYTLALVPHNEGLDQALFAPAQITVAAGHRYTVAAVGQTADKDVHALVVDETQLEAGLGAGPNDSIAIDINNLKGPQTITEQKNGKAVADKIQYGEVRPWFIPSGTVSFAALVNGTTTETAWEDIGWAEPGVSVVIPWFGPYPFPDHHTTGVASQATSERSVIDFLAGFNGRDVKMDGHLATFSTFLAAIDRAGMRDELLNRGPYLLLAPTDEAFDALPPAEREALLKDPQALASLMKAHMVDGYYPHGSLYRNIYGRADRELTSRAGASLYFFTEFTDKLNDQVIGPNYTVGNGNRVHIIYNLLPYK